MKAIVSIILVELCLAATNAFAGIEGMIGKENSKISIFIYLLLFAIIFILSLKTTFAHFKNKKKLLIFYCLFLLAVIVGCVTGVMVTTVSEVPNVVSIVITVVAFILVVTLGDEIGGTVFMTFTVSFLAGNLKTGIIWHYLILLFAIEAISLWIACLWHRDEAEAG